MTNPNGNNPDPVAMGGGGDMVGALINAGVAIYDGYQNRKTSKENTQATIKANKQQAEYAYAKDLEMWNLQNQYNSPEAQMARLRAAGLNPNMLYGSGASGASGNSSQMPKYNAPTAQYSYKPMQIAGALQAFQNFEMRQAQINNVKAQTNNVNQRTITEQFNSVLKRITGERADQRRTHEEHVLPYQAAILGGKARSADAETAQAWQKLRLMNQQEVTEALKQEYVRSGTTLQGIEAEKRQAQALFEKYKAQWASQGITSGDDIVMRVLVRMISEAGLDLTSMIGGQVSKNLKQ